MKWMNFRSCVFHMQNLLWGLHGEEPPCQMVLSRPITNLSGHKDYVIKHGFQVLNRPGWCWVVLPEYHDSYVHQLEVYQGVITNHVGESNILAAEWVWRWMTPEFSGDIEIQTMGAYVISVIV